MLSNIVLSPQVAPLPAEAAGTLELLPADAEGA
jgi:hypothetical protein